MNALAKCSKGKKVINSSLIYLFKGMAAAGFIPAELGAMLDRIPGGLTLEVVEQMAARVGADAGIGGGLDTLLGQPVNLLCNFLPPEKKEELTGLLQLLNGQ